jgi:hypothetical protein
MRPMLDGENIRVHLSVKTRMDLASEPEGGKYEPKTRFDHTQTLNGLIDSVTTLPMTSWTCNM